MHTSDPLWQALCRLTRAQLIDLLENSAGIQCYDRESLDTLREAAWVNIEDETIPFHHLEEILFEN